MIWKKVKQFLGLRGSWKWACQKMDAGRIIRPGSATGSVRYRLDNENQRRIIWCFPHDNDPHGISAKWDNANIFLSDFEATDWEIIE